MSIKSIGVATLARALAAGLVITGGVAAISTPAMAALTSQQQEQASSLASQLSKAAKQAAAEALASSKCDKKDPSFNQRVCDQTVTSAVSAALQLAILQSGDQPAVALAAINQARSNLALSGSLTAPIGRAFTQVAQNIDTGSVFTAATQNGPGGGAFGNFGGLGGGAGGGTSDYRPSH